MKAAVFLLLLCLGLIVATNPGFKARITQAGVTYANKIAMSALSKTIRNLRIPDQSGKSGHVSWTVSGATVSGLNQPASSMILSSSGIHWGVSVAKISVHGKVKYKYKKGWIKISDHLSFDASVSGVSLSLAVVLGDTAGKPRLTGSNCLSAISGAKVKFHGGASWLYNLFDKPIAKKVKDMLQGKLCQLVLQAIDKDANNQLAKLPMSVVVAKKFLLDYSLNSKPAFNSKYMETMHKGEVYWNGDKKECPFSPGPLPTNNNTTRMLYLWVSEYMGNSLAFAGFKHGFLRHNLTAKDLPPGNRSLLNTTCSGVKCIGKLIPEIGRKYPNSTVMFRMNATAPPQIKISKGVVKMNFSGDVALYALTPTGKTPFLLTITCVFVTDVTATIQGQLLKGKITNTKLNIGVRDSQVGPVSTFILNLVMNAAIDGFVVPTLNAQGQKGLVLPVTDNIKFSRAQLSLLEGAVLIATDLSYQSDVQETDMKGTRKPVLKHPSLYRHDNPDMSFRVIGEKHDIFDQI